MPDRVNAFHGVDVNIIAYGQTGSGKTHTMFGPPGIMASAGSGEFGMVSIPQYGLCPRGILDILGKLKSLKRKSEESDGRLSAIEYVLTCSAVEMTTMQGNIVMLHQYLDSESAFTTGRNVTSNVCLSRTTNTLYGMKELLLKSDEDIYMLFAALNTRNTSGTGLNDTSSRSHCFVFLTLYAHDPETHLLRKSRFQFVDLAGSERMEQAHNGQTNWRCMDLRVMEGSMTNYSLMMLSTCVRSLTAHQKKQKRAVSRGKELNKRDMACEKDFSFRACLTDLIPLLAGSMSGRASTLCVVCISSSAENASQSRHALDFGNVFSQLNSNPIRVKAVPITEMWKHAQKQFDEAQTALEAGSTSGKRTRYTMLREAQERDALQLMEILKIFT